MTKMTKMSKLGTKLLSTILALVMLLGVLPIGALPASAEEPIIAVAPTAALVNQLQDGNFTVPIGGAGSPWTAQVLGTGSIGAREIITEGPDAPSQKIPVTNGGTANWHLLFQQMFTFKAGIEYDFYLTARASVNRPMTLQLSDGWWSPPNFNLTTEWQTFGPIRLPVVSADTLRQLNLILGGFSGAAANPHDVFFREAMLVAVNEPPPPPVCEVCGKEVCECQQTGWPGLFGHESAIRAIRRPVAGIFPSSAYKYPFRDNVSGNAGNNGFNQTLIWSPAVEHAFLPNTEYTLTVLLEPNARWANNFSGVTRSFEANGISHLNIGGLPTDGVKSIRTEYGTTGTDGNMSVIIGFEATGAITQDAELIFFDDFTGAVPAGRISSGFFRAPTWTRQGMSDWRNDMSNVETRGEDTYLVLSWEKDNTRAPANASQFISDNWIAAGAVRSRAASGNEIAFENAFGYYEARIKFPAVTNMWGASWLMTPNWANGVDGPASARMGSEIDIIESFHYGAGRQAYGATHFRVGTGESAQWGTGNYSWAQWRGEADNPEWGEGLGFNIFDGEFHTFSLEWTPNEYIYRANGVEYARFTRDAKVRNFGAGNPAMNIEGKADIMQNPNYMKLSVEAAEWANETVPEAPGIAFFDYELEQWIAAQSGEMLVDYVKVWNGPRPAEAPPVCDDCRAKDCICDNLHEGRVGDIRMIRAPIAGEFPSSAFLNPSRDNGSGNAHANGYHTTFTWNPPVDHAFLPNTEYTVTVLLEPNDRWGQASGTATSALLPVVGDNTATNRTAARIAGFHGNGITPANFGLGSAANFGDSGQPRYDSLWDLPGVKSIDWEYGQSPSSATNNTLYGNLRIYITFEATGSDVSEASLVFFDDFTGPINPNNGTNGLTTGFSRSPQHNNRQGMDSWRNSQSTIENRDYATGGKVLRLGLQHNPALADQFAWSLPPSEFVRNNWIESGAVRTRGQGGSGTNSNTADIYFEHAYGHYEARVKFPAVNATWGAFWLMYSQGSTQRGVRSARIGAEIDQIETAANPFRNFNAASHWNGYTYDHSNPTNHLFGPGADGRNRNINWTPSDEYLQEIGDIYDGEWHTFAVQWTPTDYIFYINDIEWARRSRPETYQWGGSTDPNVDEGWGWGGLIGPHMLDDPRHFAGVPENPNYIKLSVEAADWSGLGVDGPGLAVPCTAPTGSCEDCIYISTRNDVTNGLGWHRIESDEMIVDWVKVWNGPKPGLDVEEPCDFEFEVRNIVSPIAGHFPTSMYKLGLRPGHARSFDGGGQNFGYDLTLKWDPPIERYFLPDTVYTAELILEPNNRWHYTEFWPRDNWGVPQSPANVGEANAQPWTRVYNDIPLSIPPNFSEAGIDHTRISNLPTERVSNVTSKHEGANLHVFITFEATDTTLQEAEVIFHDDFTKPTNDAPYTPGLGAPGSPSSFVSEHRVRDENGPASGFARATPNLWRQDLSYWDPEMSWICEERNALVLGYQRNPEGFDKYCPDWMVQWVIPANQRERTRNNTLAAGAVRTMSQDWERVYFENAYGYYEAKIAFGEALPGTWGAFWLMNRYKAYTPTNSIRGQEIDIIETINGYQHNLGRFNFNLFWNTEASFADNNTMLSSGQGTRNGSHVADVNIYDGGFHTIGLEWSPTDYIFYVNGIEVGRFSELAPREGMAINQNPNYIKLSVEAARWALPGGANGTGNLPAILDEVQEMLVDYVTVWNGPRPVPATDRAELNELFAKASGLVSDDFATTAEWNAYSRARENMQTVIDSPLVEQWLVDRIAGEFRATVPPVILAPKLGLHAFNNGTDAQVPSLAGTIRIWTQLDGANAAIPLTMADVTAVDQNGNDAMQFVYVNWVGNRPQDGMVNRFDVRKPADSSWQTIEFTVASKYQEVTLTLVNNRYVPPVPFTGTSSAQLNDLLNSRFDVILATPGNYGISGGNTLVIPEGRTLIVTTTLNVRRDATLIINGTLIVAEGGRINNDGGSSPGGGMITIGKGGRLENNGHIENVSNSRFFNLGTLVNNERFEVRANAVFIDDGVLTANKPLNINRDALLVMP